jgi:hypothetical protein
MLRASLGTAAAIECLHEKRDWVADACIVHFSWPFLFRLTKQHLDTGAKSADYDPVSAPRCNLEFCRCQGCLRSGPEQKRLPIGGRFCFPVICNRSLSSWSGASITGAENLNLWRGLRKCGARDSGACQRFQWLGRTVS